MVRQLLNVFYLIACTTFVPAASTAQVHTFTIIQEDGVTISESRGGPKYSEDLFKYELVLTLHENDSRPESLLGNPNILDIVEYEGHFFVPDISPVRIACFDSSGEYSHDIGRAGQGPGEFLYPSLQSVRNGIVTVYDIRLYRISLFTVDGTFLTSHPVQAGGGYREMHLTPEGNRILIDTERHVGINAYSTEAARFTVFNSTGGTLASHSTSPVTTSFITRNEIYIVFFSGFPQVKYQPEHGVYMTTGEEPRIQVYSSSGELKRIIRLNLPPEPVIARERRVLRQRISQSTESRLVKYQDRLPNLDFRSPKAFWLTVEVQENGYLWVSYPGARYRSFMGVLPTYRYRIINPEGEYLGDTVVPLRGALSNGFLIASLEDEDTGQREIRVYRIRSAVEGLVYPN